MARMPGNDELRTGVIPVEVNFDDCDSRCNDSYDPSVSIALVISVFISQFELLLLTIPFTCINSFVHMFNLNVSNSARLESIFVFIYAWSVTRGTEAHSDDRGDISRLI